MYFTFPIILLLSASSDNEYFAYLLPVPVITQDHQALNFIRYGPTIQRENAPQSPQYFRLENSGDSNQSKFFFNSDFGDSKHTSIVRSHGTVTIHQPRGPSVIVPASSLVTTPTARLIPLKI